MLYSMLVDFEAVDLGLLMDFPNRLYGNFKTLAGTKVNTFDLSVRVH